MTQTSHEIAGAPRYPFASRGTPFQERVWGALRDIPFGATTSYGELARRSPGLLLAVTVFVVAIGVVVASYLIARNERRRQQEMAAAFRQ